MTILYRLNRCRRGVVAVGVGAVGSGFVNFGRDDPSPHSRTEDSLETSPLSIQQSHSNEAHAANPPATMKPKPQGSPMIFSIAGTESNHLRCSRAISWESKKKRQLLLERLQLVVHLVALLDVVLHVLQDGFLGEQKNGVQRWNSGINELKTRRSPQEGRRGAGWPPSPRPARRWASRASRWSRHAQRGTAI